MRTNGASVIESGPGLPATTEPSAASLRRKIEDLEQFAARAAHDLQEPLRMVTGYTGLLEERFGETLDPKAAEYLKLAHEGARRMQDLIDGLLLISCASPNRDLRRMVSSRDAVKEALANLRLAVEESGAAVRIGELPVVLADPSQLVRLFQNLIANSIRYRAARPLEVLLDYEERERDWRFRVTDNGTGFSGRHALGLGLEICRRIAERHGGRLWMRSPGVGAVVCFTLAKT